jgi:transcriptional regulator with XRE-family HTH domain
MALEIELGRRLHEFRTARGLSLRAVAQQSGLTASFISQIERGRASPSISSLERLAEVFRVSVGQFFEGAPAVGHVVRSDQRRRIRLGGLGEADEYVTANPEGVLQVAVTTFDVGGCSAESRFVHDSDEEVVLLLEGSLEVEVGREVHTLEAGDAITYSPRTPHLARNVGRGPARAIFVLTPPSF